MRTANEGGEEEESSSVHEVLHIILPYLPSLYELICMSRVCRSLRDATRLETALWANIVVDAPLCSRLSDQILSEITLRAAGKFKSLTLRRCLRITDEGLRRVVDSNPLITTMIVTDCTSLTPEGIVIVVQSLIKNSHKLETLHVNGVYGFTKDHLSALRSYLPPAAIDVDVCPKCDQVRIIPGCSRDSCLEGTRNRGCKACRFCIPRCVECAVCVEPDAEAQETACGDILCLECWLLLPKCSFCNKPYCTTHNGMRLQVAAAAAAAATATMANHSTFICEACQFGATRGLYDYFESS